MAAIVGSIRNQNQWIPCFENVFGQPTIRFVREAARGELLQFATQHQALFGQVVAAEPMATPRSTQGEGPIDQRQHRTRQTHGATHGRFEQCLATTLQMTHALLMKGPSELVVHAPAVMHERARPIEPEQLFGRFMTAGRIDHVTGRTRADEGVQPGRATPHAPTRFVGRDLRRAPNILAKLFVGRRQRPAVRWIERMLVARAMCSSSNIVPSSFTLLPCDNPSCFIEDRQQRMHVRPQLTGRRAAGRRGLQGVSPCDRAAAIVAPADVHVEAAIDHAARNLGLILRTRRASRSLLARAVRALLRQRHVVGLVDPRWNAAVGMRPMTPARLATGLLRRGHWFVLLPKRRRLPFAATAFFFQRRREFRDLLLKRFESTPHEAILLPQPRIPDNLLVVAPHP